MAKNKPAGGLGSRVVTKQSVRNGMPARNQSPRGVSQIGSSMGNHATEGGGKTLKGGVEQVQRGVIPGVGSVKLGNEVAKNVGGGGPGTGRVVMGCGTQGMHGPAAPGNPPPRGELFPGWPAKK
jgi:hypothetical protein